MYATFCARRSVMVKLGRGITIISRAKVHGRSSLSRSVVS